MPRLKRYKQGAIVTDKAGIRWFIDSVIWANGKPKYSRLQEGSLAHRVAIGEDIGGGKDEKGEGEE